MPRLVGGQRWLLAATLVGGAVARFAWVTQVEQPRELRDPIFYMLLGEQLAKGDGYTYPQFDQATGAFLGNFPTAYYPPGYPLFLAPFYWVARLLPGDVSLFGTAVVLNVLLSILLIWLVFLLGRRLGGAKVGLAAAVATAIWPNLIFYSGIVLTETLFLVVLTLLFLVALATPEVARAPRLAADRRRRRPAGRRGPHPARVARHRAPVRAAVVVRRRGPGGQAAGASSGR